MKLLRLLRSGLALMAAFLLIPVVLLTLMGLTDLARAFMHTTGLTVAPHYTGGPEIARVEHGAYATRLHRPVFDRLIGQADTGFVQIDWDNKAAVPAVLDEAIDYNADGRPDFRLHWARAAGAPELVALAPEVGPLLGHYELADRFAVRVQLRRIP